MFIGIKATRPVTTNSPAPLQNSNKAPGALGLRERANQMSEAEKIEMTNTFVTKLKPAAEKSGQSDHGGAAKDLEKARQSPHAPV